MEDGKAWIFSDTRITSIETEAGSSLTFRLTVSLRKEIPSPEGRNSDVESTASESAESLAFARRLAVNVRDIQKSGILINLFTGSQALLTG